MTAKEHLAKLYLEENRRKYPNFPDSYRPVKKHKTTTANGLTAAIEDFLNMSGHFASRINNNGVWVREKAHVNGGYFRPSNQVRGISDISANINKNGTAIPVWIEVKIGKDRMSAHQKAFKERIERSNGFYWTVTSFDDFYAKYTHLMSF